MGFTERLADLVAFDTQNPSGDDRPICHKLHADLVALGAGDVVVEDLGRTGFVYAQFGDAPSLVLNAHVDTVPANAGYTHPPHQLVRRGDRLFGLGAADTKGAIAVIMEALASLREAGQAIAPIGILFSGDEERGGVALRAFLDSRYAASLERAIVCEPTGCRVGSRHRGVAAITAEVRGVGGHSSAVDQMVNPLGVLTRVAVALEELGNEQRHIGQPGFLGLCLNIAALDGGVAFNVVPTVATLTVSIRPGPGRALSDLLDELERRSHKAAAPHPLTFKVLIANHPLQTRSLAAFRPHLGDLVECPVDLPFWSEAAELSEKGIDAVVFGPGHIEQAHGADEYVELAQLEQAFWLFRGILGAGA